MGTIAMAKLSMGFKHASEREACRNCRHVKEEREDRMPPYDTVRWRCKKGGFMVTAAAVCKEHERFVHKVTP